MIAGFGRRCSVGDKEPFTFPEGDLTLPEGFPSLNRRRSFAWMKEVLTLSKGAFGRKEKRSEREDELPLRSVAVPDEGTYKKFTELSLFGRNVIRDS